MPKIVAVRKEDGGIEITDVMLDDGRILSKDQAVTLVATGEIEGYTIGHRDGSSYIRSLPDQNRNNNLQSLPEFDKNGRIVSANSAVGTQGTQDLVQQQGGQQGGQGQQGVQQMNSQMGNQMGSQMGGQQMNSQGNQQQSPMQQAQQASQKAMQNNQSGQQGMSNQGGQQDMSNYSTLGRGDDDIDAGRLQERENEGNAYYFGPRDGR